ncbi:protein FAM200A-like [Oratosquilla oratoria]|uniref:protein FAM200A-like n=1 Tax=Oratosquilla oratoria TaxID=337810 RepID=UPI003F7758E8
MNFKVASYCDTKFAKNLLSSSGQRIVHGLNKLFNIFVHSSEEHSVKLRCREAPFAARVDAHLDMKSQEELIEMSFDGSMKMKFSALLLSEFWIYSRTEYAALVEKALKCLLPFATTYLCESGFSTLKVLRTKHRARLQVDNDMRMALTNIRPCIDKLCKSHQAHPSH